MKKLLLILIVLTQISFAQNKNTDANLIGHVTCKGEHIPFASVTINGTTIGTTTDRSGHFQIIDVPVGTFTVMASFIGYTSAEKEVTFTEGNTTEIKFELKEDALGLDEVVVTSDRGETNRREATTIVSTLSPKVFEMIQAATLSEGLNFSPGLRMENNCQNCGFSQVRMNGMEGVYSQILINSRPIFSGLAGVYGLELIPSSMIKRVEIIRGGGSALFGSNAIAGTINLILEDPINNTFEAGINTSLIGVGTDGDIAEDYTINFNSTVVSSDSKTGMALYGFYRDRSPYDANGDDFSEIASLKNITIGTRINHRFGTRNKLYFDFFHINEARRGGDKFEYPEHEADIAESLTHNLTTAALTYEQYFRKNDLFSVFASGQKINRDSYYGAEQSLKDYGNTKDFTYSVGVQYNAKYDNSNLVMGIEDNASNLVDKKLGYLDIDNPNPDGSFPHTDNVTVADQSVNTLGVFAQYDYSWKKLKASVGARFDHYAISDDHDPDAENTGDVLSPRVTLKYDIRDNIQARVSYSRGYRAPQIFDEDLHIETSGSRKVIHENSPDLTQETSDSYMASIDYNKVIGSTNFGLLVEGFYTKLHNPFVNEFGEPDDDGTVIYTRVNAEKGAIVQGVNLEANIIPSGKFSFKAGYTIQTSKYEEDQEFNENKFFRTPNSYGYFTADWDITKELCFVVTGDYTGEMLVPYFGANGETPGYDPEDGELRTSSSFFDLGSKISYDLKLKNTTLQMYGGIKNMFNSYQSDFDSGIDRDPAYIYGPGSPRTVYLGVKFGNFL